MNIKRNNLLVILFLVVSLLGLYISFTNSLTNVYIVSKVFGQISLNLKPVKINDSATKTEKNLNGNNSVLGTGCTSGSPCEAENRLKYQPICTQDGADITIGDGKEIGKGGKGVQITDNSVIEIAEVTVPTAILSGSRYVEDSRMAIWSADKGMDKTYKNANQIIPYAEARSFCAPGSSCAEEVDFFYTDGNKTGNYEFNMRLKTNQEDADYTLNASVIEKELTSVCPKVQISSPNPHFSNRVAGNILNFIFQPPGNKSGNRTYAGLTCKEGDGNMVRVPGAEEFKSCVSKKYPFNFLIFASVTLQNWLSCTVGTYKQDANGNLVYQEPDPENCKTSIIYALEVDALMGTPYREVKNQNAGFYMDYIVQGRTAPGIAKSMAPSSIQDSLLSNTPAINPFYVSTPCKVSIDGKGIYDIPCIWDMTVYKNDWYRQRRDAKAGETNIPATFEEYWSGVNKQAEQWSKSCY